MSAVIPGHYTKAWVTEGGSGASEQFHKRPVLPASGEAWQRDQRGLQKCACGISQVDAVNMKSRRRVSRHAKQCVDFAFHQFVQIICQDELGDGPFATLPQIIDCWILLHDGWQSKP